MEEQNNEQQPVNPMPNEPVVPQAPYIPTPPVQSPGTNFGSHQSVAGKLSSEEKVFASLSYISILFIVPLILKSNNDLVHFHAKQGMVLFGAEVITWFLLFMLESFLSALAPSNTLGVVSGLGGIAWLVFMALSLVSIYFIFRDRKWEIPFLARLAAKIDV